MAHFAEIDGNSVVLRVIVVNNAECNNLPFPESEPIGAAYCHDLLGGEWKQTSYNATFRKNYAGIGFIYDAALDAFIAPKPYPSWLLNTVTCQWEPPIPYPSDGRLYSWDESTQSWVLADF